MGAKTYEILCNSAVIIANGAVYRYPILDSVFLGKQFIKII